MHCSSFTCRTDVTENKAVAVCLDVGTNGNTYRLASRPSPHCHPKRNILWAMATKVGYILRICRRHCHVLLVAVRAARGRSMNCSEPSSKSKPNTRENCHDLRRNTNPSSGTSQATQLTGHVRCTVDRCVVLVDAKPSTAVSATSVACLYDVSVTCLLVL